MKKLFYLLIGITLTFGMVACGSDDPDPRRHGGGGNGGNNGGGGGGQQDDTYRVSASEFWGAYYGDAFDYGNGIYLIQLIDGPVDSEGNLTGTGNALTMAVSGKLLENVENITLPTGNYSANLNSSATFAIINGAIDGLYNTYLEVWADGDSQSSYYFVDKGTLKLEKSGNNYKLTADLEVFYFDDNDKEVSAGKVQVTYVGDVNIEDASVPAEPYEKMNADVAFGQIKTLQGSFYYLTEAGLGNYIMTFTNCKFDKDGYFTSAGHVLTMDIYTDYTTSPDINQINGVYSVAGLEEFAENTFQPGVVFLDNNNEYQWWGSYVDEIARFNDSEGTYYDYGRGAMITGGTMTASHEGGKLHLDLNLETETGYHVTGTYEGNPDFNNEGALDWSKARKVKSSHRYMLKPFSKYGRTSSRKVRTLPRAKSIK